MRQAAVALIEKDGLFLSVSRKDDPTKLGLPGGCVEENETIEQAMVRELFEETGIKALNYRRIFKDNDGHDFETTCFLVTYYDGIPYSKEAGIVEWVEREKLETGPFAWYNKKVFELFCSGLYHKACQSHCCKRHVCKYAYKDCPVLLGTVIQDSPCEYCEEDDGVNNDLDGNLVYLSDDAMELIVKASILNNNLTDKNRLIIKALKYYIKQKTNFVI